MRKTEKCAHSIPARQSLAGGGGQARRNQCSSCSQTGWVGSGTNGSDMSLEQVRLLENIFQICRFNGKYSPILTQNSLLMENILPIHLQEIIFASSDKSVSKQISKLEKAGISFSPTRTQRRYRCQALHSALCKDTEPYRATTLFQANCAPRSWRGHFWKTYNPRANQAPNQKPALYQKWKTAWSRSPAQGAKMG